MTDDGEDTQTRRGLQPRQILDYNAGSDDKKAGGTTAEGDHMRGSRTIVVSCFGIIAAVGAAYGQNDDFAAVQVTAHPVAGNIYYLEGRGGNIGVAVGDEGIVLIDTQFAPLTEKIMAAVRSISNADVKLVLNTHVHPDHTGGNQNMRGLGLPVAAHDNVRVRMAQGLNGGEPAPADALPAITFGDSIRLYFNGQNVRVFKVPPAHTDGDSFVYFEDVNVIHVGDVFRTTGYPVIDANNGGTAQGTLDALQMVLDIAGPETKLIPGHGEVSSVADVREFRDMVAEVTRRVSALVADGMTLEQVLAAAPTADLDERWGSPDRFLQGLYQSLVAASP